MEQRRKGRTGLGVKRAVTAILIVVVAMAGVSCTSPPAVNTAVKVAKTTAVCIHESWESGKCTGCGLRCNHARWENGKCILCETGCTEHEWKNGTCVKCKLDCEHPSWSDGTCEVCGLKCTTCAKHMDEEKGVCAVCGGNCQHLHHGKDGVCKECGKQQLHKYENGVCSICGNPFVSELTSVDESMWSVCPESGIVERIKYTTHDYTREKDEETGEYATFEKQMTVYLPTNYDPYRDYNVLFLIGGTGSNDTTFLLDKIELAPEYTVSLKNMIDNMIYRKECAPLIIVGVSMYSVNNNGLIVSRSQEYDKMQITSELRYDILPYIAKQYNTYAAGSDEDSLRAARDHFGLYGISYGCIQMYNGILTECLDLFGWYTAAAGGTIGEEVFVDKVKEKAEEYPITYYYSCAGDNDSLCQTTYYDYDFLVQTGVIADGENAMFDVFNNTGHGDKAVSLSLYNSLRLMFSSQN